MSTLLPDVEYSLIHKNKVINFISLTLDPESREICTDANYIPPDWTRLEYHQCTHCTLDVKEQPYCPIAKNISFLFADSVFGSSYEEIDLVVRTANRSYSATTTVQRALGSLFGLISSLSNCPHTLQLRPMGVFHLPLSTESETLIRASSFFLLRQYLESLEDSSVKMDLTAMVDTYRNLKELNRCFVKRFRNIGTSDATMNALVLLELLARDVDFELEEQLGILKKFFDVTRVVGQ